MAARISSQLVRATATGAIVPIGHRYGSLVPIVTVRSLRHPKRRNPYSCRLHCVGDEWSFSVSSSLFPPSALRVPRLDPRVASTATSGRPLFDDGSPTSREIYYPRSWKISGGDRERVKWARPARDSTLPLLRLSAFEAPFVSVRSIQGVDVRLGGLRLLWPTVTKPIVRRNSHRESAGSDAIVTAVLANIVLTSHKFQKKRRAISNASWLYKNLEKK